MFWVLGRGFVLKKNTTDNGKSVLSKDSNKLSRKERTNFLQILRTTWGKEYTMNYTI